MILSKVRTYIKNNVELCKPSLKEWDDEFNIDNIPSTKRENRYHINYDVTSIDTENVMQTKTIVASVTFFYKGFRHTADKFDEAMDEINGISQALVNIENINLFRATDDYPIQSCIATSQIGEPLETNDNSINITLNLSLTVIEFIN